MRVLLVRLVAALCLLLGSALADARPAPAGYPRSYDRTVAAARREGALTIWSTTDALRVETLLADFRTQYPGIRVRYQELPAQALHQRFLEDARKGKGTADLLWSSAMDLQIKLVNDGYAQRYASPEKPNLPEWAVWKNEAWGTSAEPIVFAYNRPFMKKIGGPPRSHTGLADLLTRNAVSLRGKVGTYDPASSAVGYLYLAQDLQANRNSWDIMRAMGRSGVRLHTRTESMLKDLGTGELAFAYNVIGSYALEAAAHDPRIGVIAPRDYTLVMSRIVMIPQDARHSNAARLFLDFLLSKQGQTRLAQRYITPVRADVPLPGQLRLLGGPKRAIRVGPALMVHQDRLKRMRFLREWRRAISSQQP